MATNRKILWIRRIQRDRFYHSQKGSKTMLINLAIFVNSSHFQIKILKTLFKFATFAGCLAQSSSLRAVVASFARHTANPLALMLEIGFMVLK